MPYRLRKSFSLCLLALCLSLFFAPDIALTAEDLTLEDVAKTEAAKLFISKQYVQSLEEFQKLETQYPESRLIKHYIAALHDLLHQWDKAAFKLQELIASKPDDFPAVEMLGDIYQKQGKWPEAESRFSSLVSWKDLSEKDASIYQKKLDNLRALKSAASAQPEDQMNLQGFIASEPMKKFSKGLYGDALAALTGLQNRYPKDVLIYRIRGIALSRLGRHDESIQTFRQGLSLAPQNAGLHYHLGEAYLEKNMPKEARTEFQWVITNDQKYYKPRAKRAIFKTLGPGAVPKPKPWSLRFDNSYEYDTNAVFKSSDPAISTAGDQNSSRFITSLSGSYQLYRGKNFGLAFDSLYSQTLYEDFPHLQTYNTGGGLSGLYSFSAAGKPAILNIREGLTWTILKNKFYVFNQNLSGSLTYLPHRRVSSTFSYRFGVSEYDSGGSDPRLTNRDGYSNIFGLSATYYLNPDKSLYLTGSYDFERHDTRGVNFVKNVHGGKLGLHFPILEKVEGDLFFRFKDSNYMEYSSTPPKRRDDVFVLTSTLSRPLGSLLRLSLYYTLEDSRAKNNLYEYTRHIFGSQISVKY